MLSSNYTKDLLNLQGVDVIKIKQTMPMRSHLREYYDKEFNMDLKIWKEEK